MAVAEESSGSKFVTAGPREGRSVWVMGARDTFKVTGKQTGGSYGTVEAEVPPGHGASPHIHRREDESFYVIEGEMAFVCGEKSFVAKAGSFLHVPRGMLHAFQNNSESMVRMLVTYSPAGFEQFFEKAGRVAVAGEGKPEFDMEDELKRVLATAPEFSLEFRVPQK